jgi:hypothetical protein
VSVATVTGANFGQPAFPDLAAITAPSAGDGSVSSGEGVGDGGSSSGGDPRTTPPCTTLSTTLLRADRELTAMYDGWTFKCNEDDTWQWSGTCATPRVSLYVMLTRSYLSLPVS